MDALSALNNMASNALPHTAISPSEAERWRLLFDLHTVADARSAIEAHRSDLTRVRLSDEAWQTLRNTLEPAQEEGRVMYWDKEAYEFYLGMQRRGVSQSAKEDGDDGRSSSGTWLIQMAWPLDDVKAVEKLLERKVKVRNGTSMEVEVLKRHLALQHVDTLRYASYARVRRAKLKLWAGKYKALVDGEPSDTVEGTAFLVQDEEQEDALRVFETEAYDVVRCEIEMQCDVKVPGLTFIFAGNAAQLR